MHPLESYVLNLREIRASAAAVDETSYYSALENLLNEVGKRLKPKVRCIMQLKNRGAGFPDGGLFTQDQYQRFKDSPALMGQSPARGAIEAKPVSDDAWITAGSEQVTRYWGKYRQVLVTNYRDFVLVGQGSGPGAATLESFRLAETEDDFWALAEHPRKLADRLGDRFVEFLTRVTLHAAVLASPQELAAFLASYAREAKLRIEHGEFPTLTGIRSALEEALGMKFEGDHGERFFRSTLVQTLFYGMFSAWVLWSKDHPPIDRKAQFDWRNSAYYLRVPIIRKLFHEIAEPGQLETMDLPEVLNWAASTLNRVDRAAFSRLFEEGHAVQYFYEPFLEAFDPELRKDLGVWYTPQEIVEYMVERVDTVLRGHLGLPDGLADRNVYVLDPCCGTGAFLVAVLRRIAATLHAKGGDALLGQDVKRAALERVFGFELLPAPFVVSHLQLGLLLQSLGAPLSESRRERAGVYLTNALAGWEPPKGAKKQLLFKELEDERDAAEEVKREKPILVILGNPPYNSFAGIAKVEEERDLTAAYRTTKRVARPQGQGLNDLYVRFFRMAERRIVDKTGRGVVCFISNYSWLEGLSHTGMREHYLEAFDRIWVDNLHGDRKISEYAPDGRTSETIFAIRGKSPGITVGTAISLMVKQGIKSREIAELCYRDLQDARASERRLALLANPESGYSELKPELALGLPFRPLTVSGDYLHWPRLPELFPTSFPGVKTSRDELLVDIDRARLIERLAKYFDPKVSHESMAKVCPQAMHSTSRFDARKTREQLQKRGLSREKLVRYCYRPFDIRWLYWEPDTKLLDEKRSEYFPHVTADNIWIESRQKQPMEDFDRGYVVRVLADNFGNGLSSYFPMFLKDQSTLVNSGHLLPNLSSEAESYLLTLAVSHSDLFFHVVAILHAPRFRRENSGALRLDWPRLPLPPTRELLLASAQIGRDLAVWFDLKSSPQNIPQACNPIGRLLVSDGSSVDLDRGDLKITVGWGHPGKGGVTMPSRGKLIERGYTAGELDALREGGAAEGMGLEEVLQLLGERTCDVYLNDRVYWANIPRGVWNYTVGGYQVIKKWLSYRESKLLKRSLTVEEARHVIEMTRRIAAILLMGPALDRNYEAVKRVAIPWVTMTESAAHPVE